MESQVVELTWDTITRWESDEESMAFCFQYNRSDKPARWVKVYTPYVSPSASHILLFLLLRILCYVANQQPFQCLFFSLVGAWILVFNFNTFPAFFIPICIFMLHNICISKSSFILLFSIILIISDYIHIIKYVPKFPFFLL